jgi:hypothetical protein
MYAPNNNCFSILKRNIFQACLTDCPAEEPELIFEARDQKRRPTVDGSLSVAHILEIDTQTAAHSCLMVILLWLALHGHFVSALVNSNHAIIPYLEALGI